MTNLIEDPRMEEPKMELSYGHTTEDLKKFLAQSYRNCMTKYKNVTFPRSDFDNSNITTENNMSSESSNETKFCPVRFDGYLCWPPTRVGLGPEVVSQQCPDFVEGFNIRLFAHKTCLENGTWLSHPHTGKEWSNYTNCVDSDDFQFRTMINDLYIKGYIISLVTLVLSLLIFLSFRSLKCTRIRIHIHLFSSLALTCILWILWYKYVVERPQIINSNPLWCVALHLATHYLMLVNYFWMFCEGLHLHLVLVVVFVKDTIVMRWFMAIGWLAPIIFITSYGLLRGYYSGNTTQCWMPDSELLWILSVPVCLTLFISFIFLVNVVRVLVKKLHPCSTQPAPLALRKAVRATIILVPLFGIQHFLIPYRPDHGTFLEKCYQYMSVFLVSLQGVCVSCLFCFANHDVLFVMRNLLSRVFPGLIQPPPPSTNTGQLATQTPSRELGV